MTDPLAIDPGPVRPVGLNSGTTSLDTPPPPSSALVQTRLVLPDREKAPYRPLSAVRPDPYDPDIFLSLDDGGGPDGFGDPIRGIRIAVSITILAGVLIAACWHGLPWLADVLRRAWDHAL